MGEVRYDERMNAADALLWANERDPMLRSTILSIMILEGAPDDARFAEAVNRALLEVPRLEQRVVVDPLHAAPPRWEPDPHFDPSYHLRRTRVSGAGTLRDLLNLATPIAMQAFDKDRPLWELHHVEGLEHGRHAVIMKIHHAISDGVGLVRMTRSLVERSPEGLPPRGERPARRPEEPAARTPFEDAIDAIRYRANANWEVGTRATQALTRGLGQMLRDPVGTLRDAGAVAGSVARTLRPVSEPMSPVMVERSLALRLDALEVPLDTLKQVAKSVGGTLNDAFVGAVTGGLRRYHERHGRPVAELRMTMPINVRHGEDASRAGNQFVPARFAVPVGIQNPVDRMQAIRALVKEQRAEPALPLLEDVSAVIARLPRVASVGLLGSMLKAIDFVTTNVPGPPFPVYFSGPRVVRMIGFGPLSGAAVNVTLFSYDGRCEMGIACDRAAVPDGDAFVACLEDGLEEVLAVA